MDLPNEERETAKRQAIQAIMRDSTLSAQERQRMIQDLMNNGVTATGEIHQTTTATIPPAVSSSDGADVPRQDEPPTTISEMSQRKLIQNVVKDDDVTSQEKQENIQEILSTDTSGISSSRNHESCEIGASQVANSSVPSSFREVTSSRVSAVSGSQDLGALKGRRSSTERSARVSSNRVVASRQTSFTQERWARKSEGASSSKSEMNSGSAHRDNATSNYNQSVLQPAVATTPNPETVAGRDAEIAQNTTVTGVQTHSQPLPGQNTESQQHTREAIAVEFSSQRQVPSPTERVPETADYAGLNYSGNVAMDGIAAYVAPDHTTAEAIDALGVVTETQLKEEDKRQRRRYLLCGIGIFATLMIIVIVPVVLTQKDGRKTVELVNITEAPSNVPSTSPTTNNFAELLSNIEELYGDTNADLFLTVMSDEQSPQYKAAVWAADNAPEGVVGSDPRMVSRYALAALYFSTNGDDWDVCGRGSTNCAVANEWLIAENECDWYAVECADASKGDFSVIKLDFPPNQGKPRNIGGTLPFDVSFLSHLTYFVLTRESVSGPFPDWSRLTGLENMLLNYNKITGSFPAFLISQNSLLGTLHLEGNSFHGQLPSFSKSTSLSDLRLNYNDFTGSIASEIVNLQALTTLFLDNNAFVGNIPESLYSLTGLSRLHVSNNTGLTGSLSTSIGEMSNLISVSASNTSLSGSLPESLFSLTKLQRLDLHTCNIDGGLSQSFANLTELGSVILYDNNFTGTIPPGFGQLTFLTSLELHTNDLTGSVPEALCARRGDGWSDLKVLTVDVDEVICTCCTN